MSHPSSSSSFTYASSPPPSDEPVDALPFARFDLLRRRLLQTASGASLATSLVFLVLTLKAGSSLDTRDVGSCLVWILPLAALQLSKWHLPTTLSLLLPPVTLYQTLEGSRLWAAQGLVSLLWLIAATSPRRPNMIASQSPFDEDQPGDLDEAHEGEGLKEAFLGRRKGNVGDPAQASVLSAVFFHWRLPLLRLSQKVPILQPYHIPIPPSKVRSRVVIATSSVVRMFDTLLGGGSDSTADDEDGWKVLMWEIWRVNKRNVLVLISLAVGKALLTFVPAFLLSQLIRSLEGSGVVDRQLQLWLCAGLAASEAAIGVLTSHATYWEMSSVNKPMVVQLRALLFDKTLVRKDITPTGVDGQTSKTQVMNLFTIDVDRIARFGEDMGGVSTALIDLVIGTTLLYSLLGPSAFLGILLNTLTIPLNKRLADDTFDVDRRRSWARDERISAVDEVLAGIRGVKFEAGEDYWEARIEELRKEEVRLQRLRYWLGTTYNLIWGSLPVLCLLATFTCFTVVQGGRLSPSIAFPSLAIFNSLTQVWTILPNTLVKIVEAVVSLKRISAYLNTPEVDTSATIGPQAPLLVDLRTSFALRDLSFAYPSELQPQAPGLSSFRLRSLTLDLDVHRTTLVVGPVASGKSLFLLGLLGEADQLSGTLDFPRSRSGVVSLSNDKVSDVEWLVESTAYVPQTPWLQNISIRANILFGLPFNAARYQQVLDCCCLRSDLLMMPDGDLTEIGERGLTLSGGQKARVSLARAVYSRARHLLVDDCLSAVDAHTAQAICSGLQGPLLAHRTLILCTHHVSLCLPAAQAVIGLKAGEVTFSGSSKDFVANHRALLDEADDQPAVEDDIEQLIVDDSAPLPTALADTKPAKLVAAETRNAGAISLAAYRMFLAACGGPVYWLVFVFFYVGTQALDLTTAWWLRKWTAATSDSAADVRFYLLVYAGITLAGVFGSAVRWIVLYDGATSRASATIHRRLLHAVVRADVRFFDTTAQGLLLNRFSNDISRVDGFLPDDWARCVMYTLAVTSSIGIIIVMTPVFALAVLALAPIFLFMGRAYAKIARDFRRLDSVAMTPLFSLFTEVIAGGGLAVIRAYGSAQIFRERCLSGVDKQTTRSFSSITVSLWLVTSFNLLNSILTGCSGVILVLLGRDAASTGFALTFALNIGPGMLDLMLRYISLDLTMVSVERIQEFSISQASDPEVTDVRPPPDWPTAGAVSVENLSVGYAASLPDVLKNVSWSLKPGENLGVCGPTGSGKSTIALSFFRMVDKFRTGRIVIDGVDIAELGTQDLRSRLAIIPQDPSLVSGTLRTTLDLLNQHSDEDLFDVLRRVHLLPAEGDVHFSRSVFKELNSPVAQHGSNFSLGERQLLVLARALLRKSRLLLLDEATSSIDLETDEQITQTIKQAFRGSTLIVIAHRLRTIIQFDKVLVLEKGKVQEFDSPLNLLNDPSSAFYALCKKTNELDSLLLLANSQPDAAAPAVPPSELV